MIKKLINDFRTAIKDPERERNERVFLMFSVITMLTVVIALAGDILTEESIFEIAILIVLLIFVPVVTVVSLYRERISFTIRLILIGLIFFVLPGLFFFGGGVEGGGIIWFIFAFFYVGLTLSGSWRKVIITLLILVTAACYVVGFLYPELVFQHSRRIAYIDSLISVILVGLLCFLMTVFQNRLFQEENTRAKKEAERAEELTVSQNRFFSSMSHEIRTPINSILGLNELILRDEAATDEILKDASGIQGSGKMLLALINDILDFSKIEAGSMDIVPVDYNVGDMLSDIVNMMWLRAQDKGLKMEVNVDPGVPSVLYGDEIRIKQVIVNLLNNAVKYTKEGTVGLRIESEDLDDATVMLHITVSDTGMGIKKEALPYLFDAFRRVDEEKNRFIEGTGLGLSIVKQLVELMDGSVTVDSVYGEGSSFSISVEQGVSDHTEIGELNIHNEQKIKRSAYEPGFRAPDANILIVDDNEMNLEVECKLLAGTEMVIDKASGGKEALEMVFKKRYDVILMDHLMPEMDGVECLENIRNQAGGMNRITPVVVLTANAGSANRDLYNRAGFDGYLVKPVSGEALEEMLIRYISPEKLILGSRLMSMREDISTSAGYTWKAPVVITSSSMCDLPDALIKKLKIPVIPFLVRTEEGVFKDGVQMGADELIRYINSGKDAVSSPPDETVYTEFFAEVLKKAHHLIHISITSNISNDYQMAQEAAKSFDNVTVIDSGVLSSSTGILVLIAEKLAQQNIPVQDIVKELESVKHRMRCSFVIDNTAYMAKRGLVTSRINRLAGALNLHPCLQSSTEKYGVGGIWMGSTKRAYKKYINHAFPVDMIPDPEVVFVTYADVPYDTLLWIKEEISKHAFFEHIVFKQASAAISSNCGPGTFGILYFIKSNKSYNIASYFTDDTEAAVEGNADESEEAAETQERQDQETDKADENEWYRGIEGIDGETAIKNSGSEDAFKTVLKIFYDSVSQKSSELEGFYTSGDWENYKIKVHAMKSSLRLIGATGLADKAQLLETAGGEQDTEYITANHASFIQEYKKYKDTLADIFGEDEVSKQDEILQKPEADEFLMQSVYEGLHEAAEAMDCDAIEDILTELNDYSIPENEKDKFNAVLDKAAVYDYSGLLELLDG